MRNLLIKAIREGNKEKVDDLLCVGVDANVKDKNRWTPLMWASFLGYMDVVDLLLDSDSDSDVDVNFKNKKGESALSIAFENMDTEMAKRLMEAGAELNVKDKTKEKELFDVLSSEFYDVVDVLRRYYDLKKQTSFTKNITKK